MSLLKVWRLRMDVLNKITFIKLSKLIPDNGDEYALVLLGHLGTYRDTKYGKALEAHVAVYDPKNRSCHRLVLKGSILERMEKMKRTWGYISFEKKTGKSVASITYTHQLDITEEQMRYAEKQYLNANGNLTTFNRSVPPYFIDESVV